MTNWLQIGDQAQSLLPGASPAKIRLEGYD